MSREDQLKALSIFPRKLYKILKWGQGSSTPDWTDTREETTNLDEADVITSEIANKKGWHTIAIDLDVPAKLVPSSTDGHSHLYIDVPLSWTEYERLLRLLSSIGVIEPGYFRVSKRFKRTSLRLPWVSKDDTPDDDFPLEEMISYGKTYVRREGSKDDWRLKDDA